MFLLISIVIICILLEGFFSGSELAIIAVNRANLQHKIDSGSKPAIFLHQMLKKPEILIGTTLLGTNLSTVSANFAANELFARAFGMQYSWLSVFITIPMILFFGEIIPKAFYRKNADTLAYYMVFPLKIIATILKPVVVSLMFMGNLTRTILIGRKIDQIPEITREEFLSLLQMENYPVNIDQSIKWIENLSSFVDKTVADIAIPMIHVIHCQPDDSYSVVLDKFITYPHSKIVVYNQKKDEITGFINDIQLLETKNRKNIAKDYAYEPTFIPENTGILQALSILRENDREMSVVIDEYGSTVGIITLKDIIGEITGKLSTEEEINPSGYINKLKDNKIIVEGRFKLDELQKHLNISLPDFPFETVNGLLNYLLGKIPKKGNTCTYAGFRFQVLRAKPQRAEMVKIEKMRKTEKNNE